jgi:hypothetical protein
VDLILLKKGYINNLLMKCDILFIQEHWLSDAKLHELSDINNEFISYGVCGFDNSKVLEGRPYGGVSILWRASISAQVEHVATGSYSFLY